MRLLQRHTHLGRANDAGLCFSTVRSWHGSVKTLQVRGANKPPRAATATAECAAVKEHMHRRGFVTVQPPVPATLTSSKPHHGGRIELIIGPMFAGKTTSLLAAVRRHTSDGKNVLVVKSTTDTRSKIGHIQTHDGKRYEALTLNRLADLRTDHRYAACEVVAIDEAQFFGDLLDSVITMADTDQKAVIAAGLDGDFQRKPFGQLLYLVPHAEVVTKLQAFCHLCEGENKASFTQRKVQASTQVLVGGADKYRPVCRQHYLHPHSREVVRQQVVEGEMAMDH